jgi:hypothetical protein
MEACVPKTNAPQVEWGWRIQCADSDCEHYLSEYQSPTDSYYGGGPPGLPWTGGYDKATELGDGWFFLNQTGDHGVHRAYCPEHSAEALAWVAAMSEWRDSRRTIGKKTHTSLLDRLKEWGASLLNRNVGKTVQDWSLVHPRPEQPWKEAA